MASETLNMALSEPEHHAADARAGARSSLYLGAALYCDGSSTPARIRNMSAEGALVEAAVLPEIGALVQLVRGTLIVHGLVIWCAEGRCGLKFSGAVVVQQWRTAPANAEQHRVDEVVSLVKAGAVPLPVAAHSEPRRHEGGPAEGGAAGRRHADSDADSARTNGNARFMRSNYAA